MNIKGYTLVEMLVALALTGICMSVVYLLFIQSGKYFSQTLENNHRNREKILLDASLRKDLREEGLASVSANSIKFANGKSWYFAGSLVLTNRGDTFRIRINDARLYQYKNANQLAISLKTERGILFYSKELGSVCRSFAE